jgi:hypothetical protein
MCPSSVPCVWVRFLDDLPVLCTSYFKTYAFVICSYASTIHTVHAQQYTLCTHNTHCTRTTIYTVHAQYTLCTHNNKNLHTYLNNYNSVYFAFQYAFNFENEPTRKNFSNYTQGWYFHSHVYQSYQHLKSLKKKKRKIRLSSAQS